MWTFMEIPKILHQTWKTRHLPEPISLCVESLRLLNPGWENRFHEDKDWAPLIAVNKQIDQESFDRFPAAIQRADIFRCLALYEQGGVYADLDMLGVRPLDSLIHSAIEGGLVAEDTEMILTTDHPFHSRMLYGGWDVVMNNFMISKPRARFLQIYLESMKEKVAGGMLSSHEPVGSTGPVAMSELLERHGGAEKLKVAIVPYFWINPFPDLVMSFPERQEFMEIIGDGSWRNRICPYLIHCWWHSYWESHDVGEIYRYLIDSVLPESARPSGRNERLRRPRVLCTGG
jgi:inositol phosphorylceramide mannosyltransferase catalytic subunit